MDVAATEKFHYAYRWICRSLRQFYRAKFLRHAASRNILVVVRFFIVSRVDVAWNVGVKKEKETGPYKRTHRWFNGVWRGVRPARGVIYPVIRPEIKIYPIKNSKYLFRLMLIPWIMLLTGLSVFRLTDKGNRRKQILRFQRDFTNT